MLAHASPNKIGPESDQKSSVRKCYQSFKGESTEKPMVGGTAQMKPAIVSWAILDSNKEFRNWVKKELAAREGFECKGEFSDVRAAVKSLSDPLADVLLLDIQTCHCHELIFAEKLKALLPVQKTLIVTTVAAKGLVLHWLTSTSCGYLLKPIDPVDLVKSIKTLLKGQFPIDSRLTGLLISGLPRYPLWSGPHLTVREEKILELLCSGRTVGEMADELQISSRTVRRHEANVHSKWRVHDRVELVNKFREWQWFKDLGGEASMQKRLRKDSNRLVPIDQGGNRRDGNA